MFRKGAKGDRRGRRDMDRVIALSVHEMFCLGSQVSGNFVCVSLCVFICVDMHMRVHLCVCV